MENSSFCVIEFFVYIREKVKSKRGRQCLPLSEI